MTYTQNTFGKAFKQALKKRDYNEVINTIRIATEHLGDKLVVKLLTENAQLDNAWNLTKDELTFYFESVAQLIPDKSIFTDFMVQQLTEEGFTLGVDFSVVDGQVLINDNVKTYLKELVPDVAHLLDDNYDDEPFSLQKLERNIGYPGYFERMGEAAQARLKLPLQARNYNFVVSYLNFFLVGTEAKFPALCNTNFGQYFITFVCGESTPDVIHYAVEQEGTKTLTDETALELLWSDILTSLNVSSVQLSEYLQHFEVDGELLSGISEKGLDEVFKVWDIGGQNGLSIGIIKDEMRKRKRNR
jgi:hypothetical protein